MSDGIPREPRGGAQDPSDPKQPNEWAAMFSRLQKTVRERTELFLNELEQQKFTELQLQNLVQAIAEDMDALVKTAQRQVEFVRQKSNHTDMGMTFALGAFGVIVSELTTSVSRYTRGLQLTDPNQPAVKIEPAAEPPQERLLGLPSPDSQPVPPEGARAAQRQSNGASGVWGALTLKPPKRISGKPEKLAKDLEGAYGQLLQYARMVLATLAVKKRVTRIEVRTGINQIQTLYIWLLKQQRSLMEKYGTQER